MSSFTNCSSSLIVSQKAGTASYDKIPIASNLFKKAQVIKRKHVVVATELPALSAAPALSTPTSPTPATAFASPSPQYPQFFNPFMFNPMMSLYVMGMPPPQPSPPQH
jgi:hypothetical protein